MEIQPVVAKKGEGGCIPEVRRTSISRCFELNRNWRRDVEQSQQSNSRDYILSRERHICCIRTWVRDFWRIKGHPKQEIMGMKRLIQIKGAQSVELALDQMRFQAPLRFRWPSEASFQEIILGPARVWGRREQAWDKQSSIGVGKWSGTVQQPFEKKGKHSLVS